MQTKTICASCDGSEIAEPMRIRLTIIHVVLLLLVALWPMAFGAQPGGELSPSADPLWLKVLLGMAGGAVAALVTGFFGLKQTRKKFEQDMHMMDGQLTRDIKRLDHQISQQVMADIQRIDHQINIQLSADIHKIEQQIAEQLRADVRIQAARLRERYVHALPFHTRLLQQQLSAVRDKLAHDHQQTMQHWFKHIKDYCEGRLERDDPQRAARFSAWCHYEGVFAMSTLYYTSVFFLYSQQLRSLSPFRELDTAFGEALTGALQEVSETFARKGIDEEHGGLWYPVQDNMGATVRQGDWYKSYHEFAQLFIEVGPTREDHVFLRALDFFGALGDPPRALLDPEGAEAIAQALARLWQFLHAESAGRWASAEPSIPIPMAQP